ncbi:hypothetical protein GCM10027051_31500 [Niabella terrae]
MIYLNPAELDLFSKLKCTGTEEIIKDRFRIGYRTGLRFSEYSRLSEAHLKGQLINILTKKRNRQVVIPMHPEVQSIFDRWGGELPATPSIQWCNQILKKLAAKAGIRERVSVERKMEDGTVRLVQQPKFELVKTHTARRSFATNAYIAGIPARNIMLITGHKTEDSFFRYICITPTQNAQELVNHKFFMS